MFAIDKVKQITTGLNRLNPLNNTKSAMNLDEIEKIKLTAVYSYMDELSAKGFDFINPPTL